MQLTQAQRDLLNVIAQPWFDRGPANYYTPYVYGKRLPKELPKGEWPLWGHIQHHYDAHRGDADALFHSLPRIGEGAAYAYGLTNPLRHPIDEGERVRLTMAASLWIAPLRTKFGESFIRVLQHMVELYLDRPMTSEIADVMLRSGELVAALPDLDPVFVAEMPDLLTYEPVIRSGGVRRSDGSWERKINRRVMQFRDVKTLEDYVAKACEVSVREAAQYAPALSTAGYEPAVRAPALAVAEELEAAVPKRGLYIDDALLDDLEKAAGTTTWNLDRLIALCRELNHNYTADMPHASAALIRTILDHIPRCFSTGTSSRWRPSTRSPRRPTRRTPGTSSAPRTSPMMRCTGRSARAVPLSPWTTCPRPSASGRCFGSC
ncbi:hypothetical protein F3K32_43060 [Streptomyces sp. LBUM 1483]|uniref:hypothetical protein n=1 Tax=Streptomyces scabiei TaxID=1930 RepID=UPI001B32F01C|nr:hypothetical protein [Streptomyces sp. LBUM 1483]MBP5926786.1 hypothetical protein [Streptomyces sp. LBUM 1483]